MSSTITNIETPDEVLEYVLRVTKDDATAFGFADCRSIEDAYRAFAALASQHVVRHDDPPVAWLRKQETNPQWRERLNVENSLWSELEFLRLTTPAVLAEDLVTELYERREIALSMVS